MMIHKDIVRAEEEAKDKSKVTCSSLKALTVNSYCQPLEFVLQSPQGPSLDFCSERGFEKEPMADLKP